MPLVSMVRRIRPSPATSSAFRTATISLPLTPPPRIPASPIGPYAIVPSLSDPDSKLGNYNVTINNGVLTINPAPLSVTANNKSRSYGAANPALTGNIVGIQNSDNITATYSTAATASGPVGPYSIVPSLQDPDSKLGNYNVTINNSTLTVNPAALLGTADDKSRVYGQTNPSSPSLTRAS